MPLSRQVQIQRCQYCWKSNNKLFTYILSITLKEIICNQKGFNVLVLQSLRNWKLDTTENNEFYFLVTKPWKWEQDLLDFEERYDKGNQTKVQLDLSLKIGICSLYSDFIPLYEDIKSWKSVAVFFTSYQFYDKVWYCSQ